MNVSNSSDDLLFNIIYEDFEFSFLLSKYDTVGDLKDKIYEELGIPPSKQQITCWYRNPEDDSDTLGKCCDSDSNYLVVCNADFLVNEEMDCRDDKNFAGLETCAAIDLLEYFSKNSCVSGITFHACRLEDALKEACFAPLESRKILLLYLHNKNDKFSQLFCENLQRQEVKEVLNNRFFLLGWDIDKEEYHKALIEALDSRSELSVLTNFIEQKICVALLIVPIKNSITILSCMKSKTSKKDFLETLKKAYDFFIAENEIEKDLADAEQSANDIGSTNYQQIMLNMLGDRDYDSFDHFEFDHLKSKIGFALYGPPQKEEGYEEKQQKKIESLFKTIVEQNNTFSKWKDRIIISFIYNCTEPLPSVKQKRSKNYKDYNPNTDLAPVPLFVLRKCKNSPNPCRIIIDDTGRVYKTWQAYLTQNKLPECEMILPHNGRYQADENGNVVLERHLSPACGIDTKILMGTDLASTAAGLISGGIFVAAAIPAITVAPVALVAAGATGIGVGLYSIGRSVYTLYDRSRHRETLSFVNSEARGAYLNIVAGSLGFVGAGANMAVSQLAARGFNIGQGATAAVNVINVANIGASGVSVANSGYDVFDQWVNENRKPSLLTVVQLTSSVLFFGHAVYNFKMAGTIVEESQAKALSDYQDSLRSNRHRKTFNKLLKETIRQNDGNVRTGQAEVIKTITQIQNKDDVFATLTRLNKKMNQNDVKFSADNGVIKLNGHAIDMVKLGAMDKTDAAAFLSTLSNNPEPTQSDVSGMTSRLQGVFSRRMTVQEMAGLAMKLAKIFFNTEETIKEKIINAVASIVMELMGASPVFFRELDKMFPGCDKFMRLFSMVNGYFQEMIDRLEEQYQKWLATKDPDYEKPIFLTLALDYSKRVGQLFHFVSEAYFIGNNLTEAGLKELIKYFYTWFANQVLKFEEYSERRRQRMSHSASPNKKAKCPDCGGMYYH